MAVSEQHPWKWLPLLGYGFLVIGLAAALGLIQNTENRNQVENEAAREVIVMTAEALAIRSCEEDNDLRANIRGIVIRAAERAETERVRAALEQEAAVLVATDCIGRVKRIARSVPGR